MTPKFHYQLQSYFHTSTLDFIWLRRHNFNDLNFDTPALEIVWNSLTPESGLSWSHFCIFLTPTLESLQVPEIYSISAEVDSLVGMHKNSKLTDKSQPKNWLQSQLKGCAMTPELFSKLNSCLHSDSRVEILQTWISIPQLQSRDFTDYWFWYLNSKVDEKFTFRDFKISLPSPELFSDIDYLTPES